MFELLGNDASTSIDTSGVTSSGVGSVGTSPAVDTVAQYLDNYVAELRNSQPDRVCARKLKFNPSGDSFWSDGGPCLGEPFLNHETQSTHEPHDGLSRHIDCRPGGLAGIPCQTAGLHLISSFVYGFARRRGHIKIRLANLV